MSAKDYGLLRLTMEAGALHWTVPVLNNCSRPVPWAVFGEYTAPAIVVTDEDTDIFSVPPLQGGLCVPIFDNGTGTSSSSWQSWDFEEDTGETGPLGDVEPKPREVCHTFLFRGSQYETTRTIIRGDSVSTGTDGSDLPSTVFEDSDQQDDETPPSLDPCDAARCGIERIAARQHLEEDLDFREHEWLLEQAGCGRVEIWVTEERTEWRMENVQEQRPRVFFAPPLSRRQSSGGARSSA